MVHFIFFSVGHFAQTVPCGMQLIQPYPYAAAGKINGLQDQHSKRYV